MARLLRAQPVGHGSRVKAYTGADAEAWDPAGFCLFEDRDGGDAQHLGEFSCGQSSAAAFDLLGKG